jgi:hypothetical protein
VYQSSFQHDKCQVGDMHTYCRDLVPLGGSTIVGGEERGGRIAENLTIFPSTREPISRDTFHQSLSYPRIFLPPYPDQIDNHSCWCTCHLGSGIEEAGCQAREQFSE